MAKTRDAFTLFELMLVCAVIAVLVAVATLNLDTFHADTRIVAAGDMVKGQLMAARSRAVEESRPYRFEIVDASHCRVVSETGEAVAAAPSADDSDQGTPGEDTLPKDVTFDLNASQTTTNADNAGGGQTSSGAGLKIVFLPDGSALEDAEFHLTTKGARGVTLQLRALTGTITSMRAQEDHRQ